MKSLRSGHGISSGAAPAEPLCFREATRRETTCAATLGEVTCLAAAIERARVDVRAYEQTEEAWRAVWGEETEETP